MSERKSPRRPLSFKAEMFVVEYLKDLDGAAAYVRAGFAKGGASAGASRLLADERVAAKIADEKLRRARAVGVDADFVLRQAVEVHRRCMELVRPVLNPRTGAQLKGPSGELLYSFDSAQAVASLALIGRHVTVGAWEERVHVSGEMTLVDRLYAARRRVRDQNIAEQEAAKQRAVDVEFKEKLTKALPPPRKVKSHG